MNIDNQNIYHSSIFLAFLTSFATLKSKNRSVRIFISLLLIGNVTELIVTIMRLNGNRDYPFCYHIYIPIEYSLLTYFYLKNIKSSVIKRAFSWSIPIFILLSGIITAFIMPASAHPTIQFNVEGVLLIGLSLYNLLNLEVIEKGTIFRLPIFWIDVGILIFYAGNFIFMGQYNSIKKVDYEFASLLWSIINTSLNVLLYAFFIIGFLCSIPKKSTS